MLFGAASFRRLLVSALTLLVLPQEIVSQSQSNVAFTNYSILVLRVGQSGPSSSLPGYPKPIFIDEIDTNEAYRGQVYQSIAIDPSVCTLGSESGSVPLRGWAYSTEGLPSRSQDGKLITVGYPSYI